jgi:hypothetical protein
MRLTDKARNIVIGVAVAVALGTYVYIEDRPAPPREKPLLKQPTVVTESITVTTGTMDSKAKHKRRREGRDQERP